MSDTREYIYTERQLKRLCASVLMAVMCGKDEELMAMYAEKIWDSVDGIESSEWEKAYYLIATDPEQND